MHGLQNIKFNKHILKRCHFLIFANFAKYEKCFRQKLHSSLYILCASCSWQCVDVDCNANVF